MIYSSYVRLRSVIEWYGLRERAMHLIYMQAVEIQRLRTEHEIHHVRNVRDLVESFTEALEYGVPDEDLMEDLRKGLCDLNDHLARLEEHSA